MVYFPGSRLIGSVACPLSSVVIVWVVPFRFIAMSFPFKAFPLLSFSAMNKSAASPYVKLKSFEVKLVETLFTVMSAVITEDM